MADEDETLSKMTYGWFPTWAQVLQPNHKTGSFVGNDTDNHDYRISGRGKGRMIVGIHNATNKDITVTVYGMHAIDGSVGDAGTFELGGPGNGSFTVTAAADWDYAIQNDPFPFYLIRCTFGDTPDGETVSVFVDFQSA